MKKKYFIFICSFLIEMSFSQTIVNRKKEIIEFDSTFSIGLFYPIEFGNTALGKGHSANFGLTTSFDCARYKTLCVGVGAEIVDYYVSNKQIIGNYETSRHKSIFAYFKKDISVTKKVSFTPSIGYGFSELIIRKDAKRRGTQDGNEFRLGTFINYTFNKQNILALSINYINNRYDVKTTPELIDFFSKSNSIQLGVVYKTK